VEPPEQIALTDDKSDVAKEGCSSIATSMVGTPTMGVAAIGRKHFQHQAGLEGLDQHLGSPRATTAPSTQADAAAGVEQRPCTS